MDETKKEIIVRVLSIYLPDKPYDWITALAQELCTQTGLDSGKLCGMPVAVDSWGYRICCTLPEGHTGDIHTHTGLHY